MPPNLISAMAAARIAGGGQKARSFMLDLQWWTRLREFSNSVFIGSSLEDGNAARLQPAAGAAGHARLQIVCY